MPTRELTRYRTNLRFETKKRRRFRRKRPDVCPFLDSCLSAHLPADTLLLKSSNLFYGIHGTYLPTRMAQCLYHWDRRRGLVSLCPHRVYIAMVLSVALRV